MSCHTKLDENIEGADNFRAWKYRISLVLEENELDSYINEEVPVPKGDEAKALHKKKLLDFYHSSYHYDLRIFN